MRVEAYYCEEDDVEESLDFYISDSATDKEILNTAFELAMNKCTRLKQVKIISKELD